MEKLKLYAIKNCLRISTLICLFSLQAQALEFKSFGFDLGLNGSILYTDADDSQLGFGSGEQFSVYTKLDIKREFLAKVQLARTSMNQSMFNETRLTQTSVLKQTEQSYYLLLVGIEKQYATWFWEVFSGLSFGRDSEVVIKDTSTELVSTRREKTASFLVFGGAIGYRMPYKDIHIITRLKTFTPISNQYKEALGDENFYLVLPLMMSIGLEF